MGMFLVGRTQDLPFVRPGGAHQALIVHAGDHVLQPSVAVIAPRLGVIDLIARRKNDRPDADFNFFRPLSEIDGLVLTDPFTNPAFLLLEVETAFVDVRDQGNGLRKEDMDGFIL